MKTVFYVYCPKCGTKHYLDEIELLPGDPGIWEFGMDLVHYVCPEIKEKTQSLVLGYE